MKSNQLVMQGNELRAQDQYWAALECYAHAFKLDPNNKHAWNNYGNVLREVGQPRCARPFLERAIELDPGFVTANFNLAIADLLAGDYDRGWKNYEWRWQYEHLADSKPRFAQPEWQGQDLNGKTILVIGEQGFGDNIQFSRFLLDVHRRGAQVIFQCLPGLVPLFQPSPILSQVIGSGVEPVQFDYWISIMSLPGVLGVNLENLRHDHVYLQADAGKTADWAQKLAPRNRMRVGIAWSGRSDSWANRYKQLPLHLVRELVSSLRSVDWISLQVEPDPAAIEMITASGMRTFPGAVADWSDTAALVQNLDLVISVDTSVAHLSGALGIPTWVPLTKFAVDWRWLVDTDMSPWYPTMRLWRQRDFGSWPQVVNDIQRFLPLVKI